MRREEDEERQRDEGNLDDGKEPRWSNVKLFLKIKKFSIDSNKFLNHFIDFNESRHHLFQRGTNNSF